MATRLERSHSMSFPSDGEECYNLIERTLGDKTMDRSKRIELANLILERADDEGAWKLGPLGTSYQTYSYSLEVDWRKKANSLINRATLALSPKTQEVAQKVKASIPIPDKS